MNSRRAAIEQVDIHSHILPCVDDGARNLLEALNMLRMAAADGTTTIVATPHQTQITPDSVRQGAALLCEAAAASGIDIAILAGCEVRFSATLAEDFRDGKLLSLNDQGYLLVEFPFSHTWSSLVRTALYTLQLAGATPVIAHAERYPTVQEDPTILVELIEMGIPVQINAGSLTGEEGERERHTAERLIRARVGHVLASDGHRLDKRMPLLSRGYARVAELAGDELALEMQRNAVRIIAGRGLSLPAPDISALRPASRFHRMLKRFAL